MVGLSTIRVAGLWEVSLQKELSAGGAESMMLSPGGAESKMLSDILNVGAESAESIILSVPPAESMILSVLFGHVMVILPNSGGYKKNNIGDTEDH